MSTPENGFNSYMVHVHILSGHDLVIRDSSGSSDPYVKVKLKDKLLFRTRKIMQNLNPLWDEHFEHTVDDLDSCLNFEVFDYDRIGRDEFMGAAMVRLLDLEDSRVNELKLLLKDVPADKYMGYVLVNVTMKPVKREEKDQQVVLKKKSKESVGRSESNNMSLKKFHKGHHVPEFLVNVVLAEGRNLLPPIAHRSSKMPPNPYVKIKLGPSKVKSKFGQKTTDPKWREQYEFRSYCLPEQQLEVDVIDKGTNEQIGRCTVDLSTIPKCYTDKRWYKLETGNGEVLLLITISPIRGPSHDEESFQARTTEDIAAAANKYKLVSTMSNVQDVGFLVVKVYRAQGLASADIGSRKSDPFCVLELVNDRSQTSTVYKSLDPEWNQYFTFTVKDINAVLEFTVFDEDQNSTPEFLGRVGIPLLKIRDDHKRWYALKDRHLKRRAKGQILLEMKLMWNPIRAAVRTFSPKERKYMGHVCTFKRETLAKNMNRVKGHIASIKDIWAYIQSCFTWESPTRSLIAFITFLLVTYNWDTYMIPLFILILFSWNLLGRNRQNGPREQLFADEGYIESSEEETPIEDNKNNNTTIAEWIRGIQDKLLELQNTLDSIASTIERIKNVFTFSQPFLSCVAIIIAVVATILLYFIPLRYLIMAWGVNKFTKRLRKRRGFVASNEAMNYLSRVFSDQELRMYGEFHIYRNAVKSS